MKTRRQFFSDLGCGLGAAAFLSAFDRFSRLEAALAPAGDYRALVCVFLAGGNDGNNTVLPYDEYAAYQAVRGTALNIPKDSLLKVTSASQKAAFGLHPEGQAPGSVIGGGALDHQARIAHCIRPVRGQFPEVHKARRRLHPPRKGLHKLLVKPGKTPGGQKAEGVLAGIAQGIAGGEQKGDEVPHVVGMEVGQGQDVDGRKIEAVTQQGPEAPRAQVQDQKPARGLERQTRPQRLRRQARQRKLSPGRRGLISRRDGVLLGDGRDAGQFEEPLRPGSLPIAVA